MWLWGFSFILLMYFSVHLNQRGTAGYDIFGKFTMKRKFAIYMLVGMVIGVVFWGTAFRPAHLQPYQQVLIGAAAGMFISWFIAAAIRENDNLNKNIVDPNNPQEK
jgi:hypothetical protein